MENDADGTSSSNPCDLDTTKTIGELKEVIGQKYNLPVSRQRWVINRTVTKDRDVLCTLQVKDDTNIFIFVVKEVKEKIERKRNDDKEDGNEPERNVSEGVSHEKSANCTSDTEVKLTNVNLTTSEVTTTNEQQSFVMEEAEFKKALHTSSQRHHEVQVNGTQNEQITVNGTSDLKEYKDTGDETEIAYLPSDPNLSNSLTKQIPYRKSQQFEWGESTNWAETITETKSTISDQNTNDTSHTENLLRSKMESCQEQTTEQVDVSTATSDAIGSEDIRPDNLADGAEGANSGNIEAESDVHEESEDDSIPGWSCPQCTFVNIPNRPGCEQCATDRPADYEVPEDFINFDFNAEGDQESQQNFLRRWNRRRESHKRRLLELDDEPLVLNSNTLPCCFCRRRIPVPEAIRLHNCLHEYCRECITKIITDTEEPEVRCPFTPLEADAVMCDQPLQDREIRNLLTEDSYKQKLKKSLARASADIPNCYQCQTKDCTYYCILPPDLSVFKCKLCKKMNRVKASLVSETF